MKNLRIKRLRKYFLYMLLCVCVFVGIWAANVIIVGDTNYITKSSTLLKLAHILVGSFGCFTVITIIEGIKKH